MEPAPLPPPAPDRPGLRRRLVSLVGGLILAALALFLLLPVLGVSGLPNVINMLAAKPEEEETGPNVLPVHLVAGQPDTFDLEEKTAVELNVPAPVRVADKPVPRRLTLSGSLGFDPDSLARIQPRFAGEVVELGTSADPGVPGSDTSQRPLQYGAHVRKDQLLAVVWSKDLGEKKSELVDALTQLALDRKTLAGLKELSRTGSTSEAVLRQAERNVSASLNAANRAERTLRTWKLTEDEIKSVKEEAKKVIERKGTRNSKREENWARVEVRSPIDGLIVEKNVVRGHIADTTTDLFKVANLRRLAVYVNVYEEDLRVLQKLHDRLAPGLIPWRLYLTSDSTRTRLKSDGIKKLGLVVDPNQRTDLAFGTVDNTNLRLRVGQFVIADVDLPAPGAVVSIPSSALEEDGGSSYVLVQPDRGRRRYVLKQVKVVQRFLDTAYVRSRLSAEEKKAGLQPLRPGEWIVPGGATLLRSALEEARARARAKRNGNGS